MSNLIGDFNSYLISDVIYFVDLNQLEGLTSQWLFELDEFDEESESSLIFANGLLHYFEIDFTHFPLATS